MYGMANKAVHVDVSTSPHPQCIVVQRPVKNLITDHNAVKENSKCLSEIGVECPPFTRKLLIGILSGTAQARRYVVKAGEHFIRNDVGSVRRKLRIRV